jgi:membrane protease YdiL (CAAX protease family)
MTGEPPPGSAPPAPEPPEEPPFFPEVFEPPPLPPERVPFWGYSDLLLFAGLAIPCMLLGFIIGRGVVAIFHLKDSAPAVPLLIEQFTGYGILFAALKAMLRVQYDRPFWRSLGWVDFDRPVLPVILAGIAAALGVSLVGALIQTPTTSNPMTELLKDRLSILLVGLVAVTLGPVCEELAFRGFLQPLLVRSLGVVPGIVAAAVPFGLLHLPEYGYSWRHGVLVTLAGAGFGWMRHSTGSLKAATIMHASYNAVFFAALLGSTKPH